MLTERQAEQLRSALAEFDAPPDERSGLTSAHSRARAVAPRFWPRTRTLLDQHDEIVRLRAKLERQHQMCREAAQRLRSLSNATNDGPKTVLDHVADVEAEVDRLCDLALMNRTGGAGC